MHISFKSQRYMSKTYEIPLFIDDSQSDAIIEIIDTFENFIGTKEDSFNSNFIFDIFSDAKIAKGLYFILTKYFYDLKGLETTKIKPFELRSKLFELMEQMNLSWANNRQQRQILAVLSDRQKIDMINLNDLLYSDFSANFTVIRRTTAKPRLKDVINQYNTEIIKFLLNKSYRINFQLGDYLLKGNFVKNIIKNCRLLGLGIDIDVKEENETKILHFTILGPNDLVGRNIKYANNLYFFFTNLLDSFTKELSEIILEIQYFESKKLVLLPMTNFPSIINDSKEDVLYDSEIEKIFSQQWVLNFPHWKIEREPLIIEGNLVMIPDFLLRYRSQVFYFEIVGFWTERYLAKKSMKVSLLKKDYPNMILLVDRSLEWPKITVPTFFYDKKVPILEIGSFLKQYEEKELEVIISDTDFQEIQPLVEKILQEDPIILEKQLLELFKVSYDFELTRLMEKYFTLFKSTCNFVFFSKYVFLVSTPFLFESKKFITRENINGVLSLQKLKQQFSFIDEKFLKVMLNYLGYDIKYRSLLDEDIVFKKNKVIIPEIV